MAFSLGLQPQEVVPPISDQSKREEEIRRIQAEAMKDAQSMKAQEVSEIKQVEEEASRDAQLATTGERETIKAEAKRDAMEEIDPLRSRETIVLTTRQPQFGEIPQAIPEVVQPTKASEMDVGQALRVQYGLKPKEPAPKSLPKPKYWKEKPAWSTDPKINKIGNQIGDLAANATVYGQLFPGFFVMYEAASEIQNMIASKVQGEEYSPLERQKISDSIEDPELRSLVGLGEEGLKLFFSGMALNKIPQAMNSIHAEKMGSFAKKIGADPIAVEEQVNRWKKAGSGLGIKGEWERLKDFGKGKRTLEESIKKQKAVAIPKAEPPPVKPAEVTIPETEIRISKDVATGETVIKIPSGIPETEPRLAQRLGTTVEGLRGGLEQQIKAEPIKPTEAELEVQPTEKPPELTVPELEQQIASKLRAPISEIRKLKPETEAEPTFPPTELEGEIKLTPKELEQERIKFEVMDAEELMREIDARRDVGLDYLQEDNIIEAKAENARIKLADKVLSEKFPKTRSDFNLVATGKWPGKKPPKPVGGKLTLAGLKEPDITIKATKVRTEKPVEKTLAVKPTPTKAIKIEDDLTKVIKQEKELESVVEKQITRPEANPLIREVPPVDIPETFVKAHQQKVDTAERMFTEVLEKEGRHKPREIKERFKDLKREYPDEQQYGLEERYADTIFSKASGNVSDILGKLKGAGVRDEIVNAIRNARIAEGHVLDSVKHFKREPKTGAISGVMTKDMEKWVRSIYKGDPEGGGGGTGGIKKFTEGFFDDSNFAKLTRGFMVPQVAFTHMGLKPFYDMYREGERNYYNLKDTTLKESNEVYDKLGLTKKDLKDITLLNMTRQGKLNNVEIEGLEEKKLSDLRPAAQKRWRYEQKFFRKTEPEIEKVAKLLNVDLNKIKNYAPLYGKKGVKAAKRAEVPGMGRDDVWFGSIMERLPGVSADKYELDSRKTFEAFVDGYARFTKVGERSVPLKYLFDSPEFKEILGEKDFDYAQKWLDYAISPPPSPRALQLIRRAGYSTYLGLNPLSVGKQFISLTDAAILEKWGGPNTKEFKKAIKKMEIASIGERDVEATVVDMKNKWDRVMLWAIRKADKFVANQGVTRTLAGELQAKVDAGETLDSKSLRTSLREVSDRMDLLMMGSTPAQRPEFFRTEWGKLLLQFQSTITSRVNSYLERASGAKNNKDFLAIAKIIGAFMAGGLLESTIQDMRVKKLWDKEDIVDVLKSMGGNIPPLGTAIFALDRAEWTPTPFVQTVNDMLASLKKVTARTGLKEIADVGLTIGQILGLPKSVKKAIDGISVTEGEGKRVSRNKYIAVDKLDEKIRAWVKGQYGPTEIKEFFKDKALKSRLNKRVARIFISTKNKSLLRKLPAMTKKPFWGSDGRAFRKHARSLGFKDFSRIVRIQKRAEREGIELNPTTILNHIKDALKD